MNTEKTTAELVAEFKAKGGKVTHVKSACKTVKPKIKSGMNEYKSR